MAVYPPPFEEYSTTGTNGQMRSVIVGCLRELGYTVKDSRRGPSWYVSNAPVEARFKAMNIARQSFGFPLFPDVETYRAAVAALRAAM